jgi:hypothetical protein
MIVVILRCCGTPDFNLLPPQKYLDSALRRTSILSVLVSGRALAPVTVGFLWSAGFSVFWLRGIFNTACYDSHKPCTSHRPYNSGASFGYIHHAL